MKKKGWYMISKYRFNVLYTFLNSYLFYTVLFCCYAQDIVSVSPREQKLIDHVKQSIQLAEKGKSKLSKEVLAIPGFTSRKVKHFLNNLCSLDKTSTDLALPSETLQTSNELIMENKNDYCAHDGIVYLEIGVWKGATFNAALYNNKKSIMQAVGIDNWSEFGGPKQEFSENCSLYINDIPYQFYNHDAFTIERENLFRAPVDIYFYDGGHSEAAHEKALTYYDPLLAQSFILIVDDWNWKRVQNGTRKAFKKLKYRILFERALPADPQGSDPKQWWNGLYVAVIRKKN